MGLAAQFETIIERQLNAHAAWLPITTPYQLGDYGLISDGVFQKLGNIKEFNISFTQEDGEEASLSFVSDNTTAVDASTGAQVDLNIGGEIKANVTYKFNSDKALLVKAPVIKVTAMSNVNQVAQQLKKADGWKNIFKVVFQVFVAKNPLVLATIAAGTEVTIGAKADALPQFNIGNAEAKFSLKKNKELGLEMSGKTGVIALGLFKLNFLFGNIEFLGEEEDVRVEDLNGQPLSDDL